MKTSEQGRELIRKYEGLKLIAYKCPAGVWTIGYGSTRDVKEGMIISIEQAEARLTRDLEDCEKAIEQYVKVSLKQHQYDALSSFIFNVGSGNFKNSTLLKTINTAHDDLDKIMEQFLRWHISAGQISPGLKRRRKEEALLYCL